MLLLELQAPLVMLHLAPPVVQSLSWLQYVPFFELPFEHRPHPESALQDVT